MIEAAVKGNRREGTEINQRACAYPTRVIPAPAMRVQGEGEEPRAQWRTKLAICTFVLV